MNRHHVRTPETDHYYTDKSNGRYLTFTPKPTEFVATFQDEPTAEVLNQVLDATSYTIGAGFNLKLGVMAVQAPSAMDPADAMATLGTRPEVANVIPAMVDTDGSTRYFLPDEAAVQFVDDIDDEMAERVIADIGSRIVKRHRTPGYYRITVPGDRDLFQTLREFSLRDDVSFVEPTEVYFNMLQYIPDDSRFAEQWGLNNTGQSVNGTVGVFDVDVDAPEAWDAARGDPNVTIAVLDTGADLQHSDLANNLLLQEAWDFVNEDRSPDDDHDHGSHVTGIAAAVDNQTGIIGVAPAVRIMPLKILASTGFGTTTDAADAINYVKLKATEGSYASYGGRPTRRIIVNCSWATLDVTGIRVAIENAVAAGVVVVASAGNDNANVDMPGPNISTFPGAYPQVIGVAATDQSDRKASFSNYGRGVDISAPGVNILSCLRGNAHGFMNGTSMAAPHVAGVAALVWSKGRHLTGAEVRGIVLSTADNINSSNPGFVGLLGSGRLNAARAIANTPPPPYGLQTGEEVGIGVDQL